MNSDPLDTRPDEAAETDSTSKDTEAKDVLGTPQQETGDSQESDAAATTESAAEAEQPAADTPGGQASDEGIAKKMLIGSQRDPADPKLVPSKPKAVRAAAESPAVRPVETPAAPSGEESSSSSESSPAAAAEPQPGAVDDIPMPEIKIKPPAAIGEDLEQEINAALGDASLEELMSGKDIEATTAEVEIDGRYKATVAKIHGDNVFYTLRGHHQGVASAKQFKTPPKVGAQMDVVVSGFHADDGLYELHIPGASVSVSDWADLSEGTIVEAKVTGANTGGLECLVGNIRGFIPASQIEIFRVENLSEYINQKLQCVVTEANPRRRNLVLSHRAIAEREREANRQEILEKLEPGQTCDGTVTKLMDFGAFVDIGGGVDGLVHISKMSWDRIEHPKEVLEVGQAVKVKIEKVDKQTGKIGLSYRDLQAHPWEDVDKQFPEHSVVKGTVSRVAKFGAFVRLAAGIEGLIHISELAHNRVFAVSNIVSEGDEVEVKILSVDAENQRIGLSLKATQTAPAKEEKKDDELADETPRELVVPKHKGPLKGGKDKPSGGEHFGLNW